MSSKRWAWVLVFGFIAALLIVSLWRQDAQLIPVESEEAPAAPAETPFEWSPVALHAVLVSDDDGGRPVEVNAEQIAAWVAFAQEVFAPTGLRLTFTSGDVSVVRSTLLNNAMGTGDENWLRAKAEGNRLAAAHPGKLVVFFRHGPGARPTGRGFSWTDYNFIVMPGWEADKHCGHPHTDALAHELGHFLGLSHTFKAVFSSREEASAWAREHSGALHPFDGDGFSDTAPDPLIRVHECSRLKEIQIAGRSYRLPRKNIMSYYDERSSLSPMQVERVDWVLRHRQSNAMAMPTNVGASNHVEWEELKPSGVVGARASRQAMRAFGAGSWSNDAQLFVGVSRSGAVVSLDFEVHEAATYRLQLLATRAPDFGEVQVEVGGRVVMKRWNGWSPIVMPSGPIELGVHELGAGRQRVTFRVVGKAQASRGFHFGVDALRLTRVE